MSVGVLLTADTQCVCEPQVLLFFSKCSDFYMAQNGKCIHFLIFLIHLTKNTYPCVT